MALVQEMAEQGELDAGSTLRLPEGAQVLIVCADAWITKQLEAAFQQAGLVSESTQSITAACELARSGQFQVLITTPQLNDGSWSRLIDVANHCDLGFEVVLLAQNFDLSEWAQALEDGAFDVLNVVSELPRAAEVVK